MGPEAAKSFPGHELIDVTKRPAERAKQEIDYGRRGKGYVFGALQPATGKALTWTAARRTTANFIAFLEHTDAWIDRVAPTVQQVYAILDNLSAHRATDVLLFALAHPRWEFVFQPKYAAYLNLIEPWWKILRSLALKGQRFETWEQICLAVEAATKYWNAHRHPFHWGRRRRHRPRRHPGIAQVPAVA
jgi:transposase